jgi:putative redox protein
MSVEIDVVYQGDLHCLSTHGPSHATLVTDAPTDNGGKGDAFSPTDLVGTGLGTCVLTVMGLVAQRNKLDIAGARVRVTKEMAAAPLRRIARLNVVITMPKGRDYTADDRRKLESATGTCPVKQSLHPDVQVNLSFVWNS